MLTLKYAQLTNNWLALALGYLLEGVAFAIYPYSLRYNTLRFVTTSWASSSILVSYIGGVIIYDENPSPVSLVGGFLVIVGVLLTML